MRVALFVLAISGALSSCASPTISLSVGFPSQEAFLVTTQIDLLVVPIDGNLDQCPSLLGSAIQGSLDPTRASSSSLGLVPCDVRSGLALPDPGGGAHAFIVLGRATNGVILGGCSVAEVYPGAPTIDVDLFPRDTMSYATAVTAAHLAPGTTADQRCGGSAP